MSNDPGAPLPPIVSGVTPPSVEAFNTKIAELLKQATTQEIVEILRSPNSVITPLHNNVNNNKQI